MLRLQKVVGFRQVLFPALETMSIAIQSRIWTRFFLVIYYYYNFEPIDRMQSSSHEYNLFKTENKSFPAWSDAITER
jgi:hypothetical protein